MVMQWDGASTNLHLDTPPDDGTTYAGYLHWYRASTRWSCFPGIDDTAAPEQPSIRDTFAPQSSSAYNAIVEFIQEVHNETDELYTWLEMRLQQVSQGDVSNTLGRLRSRALALLRRVACWSTSDVVPSLSHRRAPVPIRRSTTECGGTSDAVRPSSSRTPPTRHTGVEHDETPEATGHDGGFGGSFFPPTWTSPWTHLSGACTSTHAPSSHRWRKVQAFKLVIFKTDMLSWRLTLPYLRCHPGRSWWTRCSDITLGPIWIPTLTTGPMLRILRSRLIQAPFSPRSNKDVTGNHPII